MLNNGRGIDPRALMTPVGHRDTAIAMAAELLGLRRQFSSMEDFRSLSPLPEDAQRVVDEAVRTVGRNRLVIVEDLIAEGLTRPLDNWLSVLELGWDDVNDVGHATRSMHFDVRGERMVQDIARRVIPVFGTWCDFEFDYRTLAAADRVNYPIDTSHAEQATRRVNEALEDQAINGLGFNVNGNSAPGLLTNPVNTFVYGSNEAWDASGHDGQDIIDDVKGMVDLAQADDFYGPYNLYVPTLYGQKLSDDFKANGSLTIRRRLEELEYGGRGLQIRVADRLPANRTVLVQMTSDVIDVIIGQQPQTLSWRSSLHPLSGTSSVVLACVITRVRSNYESKSGIVVGNTT